MWYEQIEKSFFIQVPSSIEFVDIAGLVRGASEGQGLGNKFLANIRETDAIIQVRVIYFLIVMYFKFTR